MQWWLDNAYLKVRVPLIPFQNMGGVRGEFTVLTESRIELAALKLHCYAKFWKLIRE